MIDDFDRTLVAQDVMEIFNCSYKFALSFLKTYGFPMGKHWAISQRVLRGLQMDGDAARFFSNRGKK